MLLSSNWKHNSTNESWLEYRQKMVYQTTLNFKVTIEFKQEVTSWKAGFATWIWTRAFRQFAVGTLSLVYSCDRTSCDTPLELKYASCKNDSYFLAVTEATVFHRKVNFFLLKAIRRLKVVRQRQNFRKSNEAQQRFIGVKWEIVHKAQALFRLF